ncbi:MAG: ester cyclase [Deltaproteobacteria bacterium]|nr:ester cyclase [Deltaproteobacteria bacterium]
MKKNYCHFKLLLKIGCSLMLFMGIGCVIVSVTNADSIEEQNKAAVRRLIDEIYHKGNMAVFDEIVADNAVLHDNERTIESLEMAKRQIRMVLNRYRDIKITIEDMIAEGDKVVTRATFRGIFRQNEKNLVSPSITISKFKDGKIIEVWRAFDIANIFRQLEISPPPQQ